MDNKTLYIAEFKEGYDLGTIISDNEIEMIYLQGAKWEELCFMIFTGKPVPK